MREVIEVQLLAALLIAMALALVLPWLSRSIESDVYRITGVMGFYMLGIAMVAIVAGEDVWAITFLAVDFAFIYGYMYLYFPWAYRHSHSEGSVS